MRIANAILKQSSMNYKIDHVGYLTGNIELTAKEFERIGYSSGDIYCDDTQKTRICFLTRPNEVRVELVEPYEENKTMQKMLVKRGVAPYHICYETDDIDSEYESLIQNNWTALFKPVSAPAFGNRRICYFFNSDIGFVEFVNKK